MTVLLSQESISLFECTRKRPDGTEQVALCFCFQSSAERSKHLWIISWRRFWTRWIWTCKWLGWGRCLLPSTGWQYSGVRWGLDWAPVLPWAIYRWILGDSRRWRRRLPQLQKKNNNNKNQNQVKISNLVQEGVWKKANLFRERKLFEVFISMCVLFWVAIFKLAPVWGLIMQIDGIFRLKTLNEFQTIMMEYRANHSKK